MCPLLPQKIHRKWHNWEGKKKRAASIKANSPPLPPHSPQKTHRKSQNWERGKKDAFCIKNTHNRKLSWTIRLGFTKQQFCTHQNIKHLPKPTKGCILWNKKNMGYTYTQDKNLCTHTCTSAYVTYILTLLGVVTGIISSPITIAE